MLLLVVLLLHAAVVDVVAILAIVVVVVIVVDDDAIALPCVTNIMIVPDMVPIAVFDVVITMQPAFSGEITSFLL